MKITFQAIHSADQLEWLLGIEKPSIYLVVRGKITDFVEWQNLSTLTALVSDHKLLFDVDDTWRSRLGNLNPIKKVSVFVGSSRKTNP